MADRPMARRELVCRDVFELATEHMEDALDAERQAAFDAHLRECEDCVRFVDQMLAVICGLRRLREQRTPG